MERTSGVLGVVVLAESAVLVWALGFQGAAPATIDPGPGAAPKPGPTPPPAPAGVEASADLATLRRRVSELETALATALRERDAARAEAADWRKKNDENLARVADMKGELDAYRRDPNRGRTVDDGTVPPEDTDAKLTDDEAKHRATLLTMVQQRFVWTLRQPIPAETAKALGLSDSQKQSIEALLADEAEALDREARAFARRALGDRTPVEVDRQDAGQICTGALMPLMQADMPKLAALPGKACLAQRRGRLGAAEIFGADRPWTRLAQAFAPIRERTWAGIERLVDAAQMAKIRESHLPAGIYRYPGGVMLDIGR